MDMKIIVENIEAMGKAGTKNTSVSPKIFESLVRYFKKNSYLGASLQRNEITREFESIRYKDVVITELNVRLRQLQR